MKMLARIGMAVLVVALIAALASPGSWIAVNRIWALLLAIGVIAVLVSVMGTVLQRHVRNSAALKKAA